MIKSVSYFLIFVSLLGNNSVVHVQIEEKEKPRIAIFPFVDTNAAAKREGYGEAISGMLTTNLINGGVFQVVERSQIEKIMKEQAFQISGAVDVNTAKRIGAVFGVDILVFGNVALFGTLIETDIRLIDTESGEAMLAEHESAQSGEGIRGMVDNLAAKIENRYRGAIAPPPPLPPAPTTRPVTPLPPPPVTTPPVSPPKTAPPAAIGEMVAIPAGYFQMGSNTGDFCERPVHTVYVNAFYLDKYEVTNAQYRAFMEATGYPAPKYWNDSRFNQPNQPVVGVSWEDALAYARWVGKRLPTEAEWEYAARGGLVGSKFPWGDGDATGKACLGQNWQYGKPDNVGSYAPNGYGLYDMAGGVWEWCADWFDCEYYKSSPQINPSGPVSGSERVLRGGAWSYDAYYARCSSRHHLKPNTQSNSVGFRCAR